MNTEANIKYQLQWQGMYSEWITRESRTQSKNKYKRFKKKERYQNQLNANFQKLDIQPSNREIWSANMKKNLPLWNEGILDLI